MTRCSARTGGPGRRGGAGGARRMGAGPSCVIADDAVLGEDGRLGAHVVVHPGTVLGDGCEVQDGAVLGKPPKLARHSTAPRGGGEPLVIEAGAGGCCRALVLAGARVGARALLRGQAVVREGPRLGAGPPVRPRRPGGNEPRGGGPA